MAGLIIFLFLIFSSSDPIVLASAALFHEAGHILAAWFIAKELPKVSFSIAGVKLSYIGLWEASQQITVSAAGPFVSILLGLIFFDKKSFAMFSLGLGAINLLPVSCLDGGVILRALTERLCLPQLSFWICRVVSVVTIMIIFVVNCTVQLKCGTNISLAVITVYLIYSSFGR